jgi:hypothetical protein
MDQLEARVPVVGTLLFDDERGRSVITIGIDPHVARCRHDRW